MITFINLKSMFPGTMQAFFFSIRLCNSCNENNALVTRRPFLNRRVRNLRDFRIYLVGTTAGAARSISFFDACASTVIGGGWLEARGARTQNSYSLM